MKRPFYIAAVTAILAGQPTTSMADFAFAGVGAEPCGQLADEYRRHPSDAENAMMHWAQGFMSGWNMSLAPTGEYRDLAALSLDVQKHVLHAYCDEHPLAEFMKAATELYFRLPLKKSPGFR